MSLAFRAGSALTVFLIAVPLPSFARQTPGAGNGAAADIARQSALVQSATEFLAGQARSIRDGELRRQTLDAINNPDTCVVHRAQRTDAQKDAIIAALETQGLVRAGDNATFPGGLKAGVFPAILNEQSACPHLPQPFYAAPGSVFHGHHSYPGGLPIHEANNETADLNLAAEYRRVYGKSDEDGLPEIHPKSPGGITNARNFFIDEDLIVAAPLWHDWGKPIVFQWNADGSEFPELNFGGNGSTDNYGASGDSTTGAHHIIGVAETMARGLSPAMVITQASAHSAPTSGSEFKVVNWLRAAAIIAGIDPIAGGYLTKDSQGNYRLPALRQVGQIDFLKQSPSQTNILVEYELHNLSDADFSFSGPAISMVETVLAELAPEFGFDASTASYNVQYRNRVFSALSAERLQIIYANGGLEGVRAQLRQLRRSGAF